ncbi:cytochrome P450 6B1-like [Bicyclus anynana]|uniref:unspecific monooxygenase n=1 Tax=Bicyclus anynana TaxID=110368 RepID=A0A6J1N0E1_BICAN|nr:cytochrome P450 6B1-like [Bicyclus anynana]
MVFLNTLILLVTKLVGFYRMTRRSLLVRDLDVIKNILIKDFEYFEDRGIEYNLKGLGGNLFHANSKIWRPLRNQLSHLFTSGKLRNMVALINERGDIFINRLKKITETQNNQEIKKLIEIFTTSSIVACSFGLDINTDSGKMMEKLREVNNAVSVRSFSQDVDLLHPGALKSLNLSFFSKNINGFLLELVNDIILARNGVPSKKNDFIDTLIELKNQGNITKVKNGEDPNSASEYQEMTNEILAAQALIFFIGSETSAAALAFTMYELALNPDIQEKLIAEVDVVLARHNGNITIEAIAELSYMDKVLHETLRKYPTADLTRRAKADYKIPGTNITIEKDVTILVPLLAISRDEKYYPNPNKFDPERFSAGNDSCRHPCANIPFGTGPRHCIGKLFAKYQSRICLIKFFSTFYVEKSKDTQKYITPDPNRITYAAKGGIHLNILRRRIPQ